MLFRNFANENNPHSFLCVFTFHEYSVVAACKKCMYFNLQKNIN